MRLPLFTMKIIVMYDKHDPLSDMIFCKKILWSSGTLSRKVAFCLTLNMLCGFTANSKPLAKKSIVINGTLLPLKFYIELLFMLNSTFGFFNLSFKTKLSRNLCIFFSITAMCNWYCYIPHYYLSYTCFIFTRIYFDARWRIAISFRGFFRSHGANGLSRNKSSL